MTDGSPGIRRLPARGGFRYVGVDGKPLRDADALQRIKSLVIPPAWRDVWICPLNNGHIQATARDAKGRKQYKYHPRWRQLRDERKYERMITFAQALPLIRKQVKADLSLPGIPREKVLATVVRLLEITRMRVGNEEYARNNKSFGLTTLRDKHVEIVCTKLQFHFKGKSGKQHDVEFDDRRLTPIVRRCRDIPGQLLFQYIDDEGEHRPIGSTDVNDYLRCITGEDYTAKDFRTWAGTLLAAMALQQHDKCTSFTQAKKNVVRAIEVVSEKLGNTPSICRKCYVHPAVIESYLEGALRLPAPRKAAHTDALTREEISLLKFLQQRC